MPGLRVGALSAGRLLSISTSRKTMPWLSNTCIISSCGPSKSACGKARRAEAILVGDHDELVAGIAQPQQRRDHAFDEAQLGVGVDLEVVRLLDQRAVAIDEQDRAQARSCSLPRSDRSAASTRRVLLRRADADAQRIAELRQRAHVAHHDAGVEQVRYAASARSKRTSRKLPCDGYTRRTPAMSPSAAASVRARGVPPQSAASVRTSDAGASARNACSAHGAGTG